MKVSNEFMQAKKDKNLQAMLIMKRDGNTFIRICIDEKSKYTNEIHSVFIETDTIFSIDNYKKGIEINKICFHLSNYNYSPVKTFLDSIKKDSEVSFKIIAYNSSKNWDDANFINHKIFGIVDNKIFLLESYTGLDNLCSPINNY